MPCLHPKQTDELREALETAERLKEAHMGEIRTLEAEAERKLQEERLEVQKWREAVDLAEVEASEAAQEAAQREANLRLALEELKVWTEALFSF